MKASCQSLTSKVIEVAGDYLDEYQEFRKNAAKVLVPNFLNIPIPTNVLNDLIDQAIDLQTKALKSYGVVVGQGKGKIGPRYQIVPTKKVTGKLVTERTFCVLPSTFDKLIITIKKTDGKAGADVAVCAKYSNGSIYNEKRKSIDKGKDSKGDEIRFVLANMEDKFLTIHLVQTGLVTNTCSYDLSIEGEYNPNKLEEETSSAKVIKRAVRVS